MELEILWLGSGDYGLCVSFIAMKRVLLVCGIVISFVLGYRYAAALYEADIATLKEDYARRAQTLEAEYRGKERVQYQSLLLALEERDKALARVSDLSGDVKRVRKQADAYRSRLSESSSDSCQSCKVELARCTGLLERGAEVAGRCGALAQRLAVDKDAVVKIVGE